MRVDVHRRRREPKMIQAIMGHATIQMTLDHYGHLMPGGLEEAATANAYVARAAATS
jgi:integrase